MIVGARSAVVGALVVAVGAMLIGNVLGLIAGYHGGTLDSTIMRGADLVYALPGLLVAIVIVGVVGGGYYLAVALLVFLYCPFDTRLVRAATLEQRQRSYVEAARTLGLSRSRIMFLHICPNVLPVAIATQRFLCIRPRLAGIALVPWHRCRPGCCRLGANVGGEPHAAVREPMDGTRAGHRAGHHRGIVQRHR